MGEGLIAGVWIGYAIGRYAFGVTDMGFPAGATFVGVLMICADKYGWGK